MGKKNLSQEGILTMKRAMNIVYYQMRRLYLEQYKTVPPFDVDVLMKEIHVECWIKNLLRLRRVDKNQIFDENMFPEFKNFVYVAPYNKVNAVTTNEIINEANELFLKQSDFIEKYPLSSAVNISTIKLELNCLIYDHQDFEYIKEAVLNLLKSKTPVGTKIIVMSVTGSRGKNLASEDSDYDIKVIVTYPLHYYMLQKVESAIKVKSFENPKNKDIEVTIISLHNFIQWCLFSNPAAHDVLYTPIQLMKDSEKIVALKKMYEKNFHPHNMKIFMGNQRKERKKGKKSKAKPINMKRAMDFVYYKMARMYIDQHQSAPPFEVETLMLHSNAESWIKELLSMRKADKNKIFDPSDFPEFENFVSLPNGEKKINVNTSDEAIKEAQDLFLTYCGYVQ